MDKIIAFSNKTEARDKFTKSIQFLAKLISWSLINVNKVYSKRFHELYSLTRDSRKIYRLFKSIKEIKNIIDKLNDLYSKKNKIPIILDILSRIGYLIFWLFDNFSILATLKLINPEKIESINIISNWGWVMGLTLIILKHFHDIICLISGYNIDDNKQIEMIIQNNVNDVDHQKVKDKRKSDINKLLIEFLGKFLDLIPATSEINLPAKFLGKKFNDGFIGAAGFTSSLIAMWSLWKNF